MSRRLLMINHPIFLTGTTGLVGRYVLRELLNSDEDIISLVRGKSREDAQSRLDDVLNWLNIEPAKRARVKLCWGDLADPDFGKNDEVRSQLDQCKKLIHAAACVSFNGKSNGEPARTNLGGTIRLIEALGNKLIHWIQVSTAYVAPLKNGIGIEAPVLSENPRRNSYEQSKAEAEIILKQASIKLGFALTIVRPAIVVGEYESGRANTFQGFYQPMRAITAIADRSHRGADGLRHLAVRLNIAASGIRNLVPVDWVSKAIVGLAKSTEGTQGIFHLTPSEPTNNQEVLSAVMERWSISGLDFYSDISTEEMTSIEKLFYRQIDRIASYWQYEPHFNNERFVKTLPSLPCPRIDSLAVDRLLKYASHSNWGNKPYQPTVSSDFPTAYYLEQYLPQKAAISKLPRLTNISAYIGLRVSNEGEWICRIEAGEVLSIKTSHGENPESVFVADNSALAAIVGGELSPQQAFFDRRIEIEGNIEMGLKLAMVFGQFIEEFPYDPTKQEGVEDVFAA